MDASEMPERETPDRVDGDDAPVGGLGAHAVAPPIEGDQAAPADGRLRLPVAVDVVAQRDRMCALALKHQPDRLVPELGMAAGPA